MFDFEIEIMRIGIGMKSHFFDQDDLLLLLEKLFLFLLFVAELPKIHDATHRRRRLWGYLDEIEFVLLRHLQRASGRENAQLFSFWADDPQFLGINFVIDAYAIVAV